MPETIGIIGAGNTATALAAYLASQNHPVVVYVRDLSRARHISYERTVHSSGVIDGTFKLALVTNQYQELAERCQTIFVATTTDCYRNIAQQLIPVLGPTHTIVLFSSKLCGSVEFAEVFKRANIRPPLIIETDALFACRLQPDGSIAIKGLKDWTLYSCPTYTETMEKGVFIKRFFPNLEPAVNVIQRGCTDFGAHAHATITLANISRVDGNVPFLFYYEGLSERTIVLLERIEQEIKAVAAAYNASIIPMTELLNRYYGCDTTNLYKAITTVPSYATILGPKTLQSRLLIEDVSSTLYPLQQLAQKAGIDTPLIQAIVHIASVLTGIQPAQNGRTLTTLGWSNHTAQQIRKDIAS